MSVPLPAVGTRIVLNSWVGTVRYAGPVDGTQGVWLGVEWDDPARGKHDGSKDGKRYFSCIQQQSTPASFIRASAHGLSYGRAFLSALAEKYIDTSSSSAKEVVTLGSSQGLIHVEAVGLERIRANLADLARLREVSLDGAQVAWADAPPQILERCANIQGLDLSRSLLPCWPSVAVLAAQLPRLARLALNHTRLALAPVPPPPLPGLARPAAPRLDAAFPALTELQLNTTLTPWPALLALLPALPRLRVLEAGYNLLPALPCPPSPPHRSLALLNLDANLLASLPTDLLPAVPNLLRLVLAANQIQTIHKPHTPYLDTLKHLSLSANPISDWPSIDNLRAWCPALEGLAIRDIPLLQDTNTGPYTRPFAIAKLPTLTSLDGAPITPKERLDSELFYLSYLTHHVPPPERASWGRYDELIQQHGRPDEPCTTNPDPTHDKMSSRLINLTLHLPSSRTPLRVLPTMPLRAFRLRVLKLLPHPKPKPHQIRLYLKIDDGEDEMDGEKEVGWWVEEGAEVVVRVDG